MKASVQYNDFRGTTAADESDSFPLELNNLIEKFNLPISKDYHFIGVSVYSTDVMNSDVDFIFEKKSDTKIVKCSRYDVPLQEVLNLFKRLEIQIGYHLDDIDEKTIEEI